MEKKKMDFSLIRNYYDSCVSELIDADFDRNCAIDKQKDHYANFQNALKTVRWYKAWRDCEFTDELVAKLLLINDMLLNENAEMCDAVHRMAASEKRRLNKTKKPYIETIEASLQIDCFDGRWSFCVCQNEEIAVTKYRLVISNDQRTKKESICSLFNVFDIPNREICEAARVFDNFLRDAAENYLVAAKIDSDFRDAIGLPENISTKWSRFFSRLDKFQGAFVYLPLLAMIGRFKLTPEDVCAIKGFSYKLNLTHLSDAILPYIDVDSSEVYDYNEP